MFFNFYGDYAQNVATIEDALSEPPHFTIITKEKEAATVNTLNIVLNNKPAIDKMAK